MLERQCFDYICLALQYIYICRYYVEAYQLYTVEYCTEIGTISYKILSRF
jgi:hypothetical protein